MRNREYKFRIWDILSRKMRTWGDIFSLPAWEIFPGTPEQRCFEVMQYTEVKDKNEKEIYEGDIVSITPSTLGESEMIGEVVFNDGSFLIDNGYTSVLLFQEMATIEILGNIYENGDFDALNMKKE
ncbi:YopX family protein [Fusobacterium necrophorum]|nr:MULTISPECIES: YopX family protein [Fusobacterium]EJU15246.1 TIGR01671 family protein [Fusobacterium necrophorum subsp. funduliforme Fnf 1007]MDK4475460.1 YopX family protein [Fusobacterium necrophorum]MDK4481890.1 YopX family protein [Fusobacterium necrophorum]MDK4513004.1 YopX family protein [Fusobacterium necrophorum]MDY6173173.1 YopX family protein [Fusobacterium necrophorum]